MRDTFDVALVSAWAANAVDGLGICRAEIDALNVFPVPDGDTGTNLFLTVESAAEAVDELVAQASAATGPQALNAFASGALLGARGNSGVITSQILRGMSDVVTEADPTIAPSIVFSMALSRASELADQSVGEPKEGTVLTVARDSARILAARIEPEMSLRDAVELALVEADAALARTPDQLQVLKDAGVVDSGARGLVVLLEALFDAVIGERRARTPAVLANTPAQSVESHTVSYGGPGYEVMFLLDADDEGVPLMREALLALGDSLVVVGGNGLWNVHVHVDDIGAAIEAGIVAGRPYRIKVTHLEIAEGRRRSGEGQADVEGGSGDRTGRGLVAVSHGPGVAMLLAENGITSVPAKPGRRPSTAELLDGIVRSGAAEVVVLPSDGDTRIVAEAAAEQARNDGIRVAVIPTRSIVQTLAAAAVHQPGALFDDDIVSMGRASAATRYGAITVAVRKAMTTAGVCEVGDVLGLVGGDIVEIAETLPQAAVRVVDRLIDGGSELLTIVAGDEADEELMGAVTSWVEDEHPDMEVEIVSGGQPLWPMIFGVE